MEEAWKSSMTAKIRGDVGEYVQTSMEVVYEVYLYPI